MDVLSCAVLYCTGALERAFKMNYHSGCRRRKRWILSSSSYKKERKVGEMYEMRQEDDEQKEPKNDIEPSLPSSFGG